MARSLTPRTRQKTGARMERAGVRFASHCGGGQLIRPHHCAPFANRCTMMRLNRPLAAATAR
eukprot:9172221-Lingulodinium_polyedra.AAC.1